MCRVVRTRAAAAAVGVLALLAAGGALTYRIALGTGVPPSPDLRSFVTDYPTIPVVFTSRSNTGSFHAAAPEAEGFAFPGTIPWAADDGRLRLLDTGGRVYELTWGRLLSDGTTLIDVMSPTVSLDGSRILFAGRKAAPDPGRWRLYQVDVTGENLRPLTGGTEDAGCIAVPPLRHAADGSVMTPDQRKRLDYDDVDPADCGEAGVAFASSRTPDLGRDHSRRATQVWLLPTGAPPRMLSANRNNDRWPVLAAGDLILFSMWSRNREAVIHDRTDVRPVSEGIASVSAATDHWIGARVMPDGSQFGYAVKISEPVWRPRPLFNGRVAFMTPADRPNTYKIAQADWGLLRVAPSSAAAGAPLPAQKGGEIRYGPDRDAAGRPLSVGCPSPSTGGEVLVSAGHPDAPPGDYGLYAVTEEWSDKARPRLLFDDPNLVDAEPAAVYPRPFATRWADPPKMHEGLRPNSLRLASGKVYTGTMGLLENSIINAPMPDPFPGQKTDTGDGPVVPHPTRVAAVAIYAAYRDRFDDPVLQRSHGGWEKLVVAPVRGRNSFRTWVPADPMAPTVLAGLDESGRVFEWNTPAKDTTGRSARFLAVAGDHYSGTRPNGYHFCVGCHTGHTFIHADIRERP